MKKGEQTTLGLHILEVVFSVIVLLWYVLPLVVPAGSWLHPLGLARTLYGDPPVLPGSGWYCRKYPPTWLFRSVRLRSSWYGQLFPPHSPG